MWKKWQTTHFLKINIFTDMTQVTNHKMYIWLVTNHVVGKEIS